MGELPLRSPHCNTRADLSLVARSGDRSILKLGLVLLFGCLSLLTSSCTTPVDVACTDNIVYGLSVTVRDSITGIPAGRHAVVVAQDGAYTATLLFAGAFSPTDSMTFVGAAERAGTYHITVTKAGYTSWTRSGVPVLAAVCHVHPASVEARLQPVSAIR